MRDETLAIHAGYETDPTTKAVAVPIYQTVAYEFDDAQHGADLFNLEVAGNIYTANSNFMQTRIFKFIDNNAIQFSPKKFIQALFAVSTIHLNM